MVLATPFVEHTILDFPYCCCHHHSSAAATTATADIAMAVLSSYNREFENYFITYTFIYILIPFHKYLVSKVQSILMPFHVNSGTH